MWNYSRTLALSYFRTGFHYEKLFFRFLSSYIAQVLLFSIRYKQHCHFQIPWDRPSHATPIGITRSPNKNHIVIDESYKFEKVFDSRLDTYCPGWLYKFILHLIQITMDLGIIRYRSANHRATSTQRDYSWILKLVVSSRLEFMYQPLTCISDRQRTQAYLIAAVG